MFSNGIHNSLLRQSGQLSVRIIPALLVLAGLTACSASSTSGTGIYPYGDEAYQPAAGTSQAGDIQHLSHGSLIW